MPIMYSWMNQNCTNLMHEAIYHYRVLVYLQDICKWFLHAYLSSPSDDQGENMEHLEAKI